MSDKEPSSFNDLSGSPDETPTRVEFKPLFSRSDATPEGTVVAETHDPAATRRSPRRPQGRGRP